VLVAIAGAHGKIAQRLTALLAARGDRVIGLIRNPDHTADVRARGADVAVCDLESATVDQVSAAVAGAEAVVFAAGAGPGSGAARKLTLDRDGAIKLLDATAAASIPYVIVSSVGAENPPPEPESGTGTDDDVFSVYLRAKAQADAAVMASDRPWTVVRPGGLTDDAGTGRIRLDTTPFRGRVTRDDVAGVLAGVLGDPRAAGRILYVNGGDEPIAQALNRVLATPVNPT
jgi:nucleoside-diphosphate-sugar epimerase